MYFFTFSHLQHITFSFTFAVLSRNPGDMVIPGNQDKIRLLPGLFLTA